VGEDLVADFLGAVADAHFDADLVHRVGVQPGFAELGQKPVAIRDPSSLNLHVVAHPLALSQLDGREASGRGIVRAAMAVATEREYGLFINGESTEPASGELRELIEPATGEPLAKAAVASEQDVDRAVDAARAALEGDWGKTAPTERSRLLHALADALVANRKELAELETRNVGKAISSVKAELAQAIENFRFYGSAIASIGGRSNPLGGSLLFYSLKEPVGVCGQIVPWNYPLMMTTWKLAPALAAGCTVVLKPDSATPLSALRMAELAAEVGFPPGTINIVPGPGPVVGAHLVQHPGVEKIAFTGSTATGSEIMRLAAGGIKRLILELGGKSPNLVFADANLEDAIPSSVWSIYYSAGQSCEARSRLLVERSIYDEVVSVFGEAASRLKVGDPLDPETQVGSLISGEHRDRVHGYVEAGREEGAEVVTGGEPPDGKGAFYPPTVLAQVDNAMRVAQEEIFGPVVTVIPFEDEKDAVRIANDVRYGLMATVWTGDPARGHRLARRIKAGTVGINMPYTAFPGIPFGGYKESGFGRELGLETLDAYLETKSVIVSTSPKPFNPFGL
jgi:acyl-CoA reductase-like NAD-dependent aldehyde dehydrogenase